MIATYALQNYDRKFVKVSSLASLEFDPEQSHTQDYKTEQYEWQEFIPTLPSTSEG